MEIDDGQDKWGDWEAGLDLGERIGQSPIVLTTASALPPSFANLNTTGAEINNNSEKKRIKKKSRTEMKAEEGKQEVKNIKKMLKLYKWHVFDEIDYEDK